MPAPARGKDQFFPRLEALRGLAALVVVASHAWRSPWNDPSGGTTTFPYSWAEHVYGGWTTDVLSVLANGAAAVDLFFVISGFVLLQSLMRGPDSNWVNAARFVVARVFRIYPAVLVTIGTFTLIFYATGASICSPAAYEPIKLLRNALLLDTEIVGVMWTLRVEMLAIPLLILGFFLLRRLGNVALVILLAILLALATWRVWIGLIDPTLGLALLPFFAVGMLVFGVGKKPWSWIPSGPAAALLIVIAVMLSVPLLPHFGARPYHIEMVCDAYIVGLLAFANLGAVGRFFEHPIVRFYGRISYSFYLINPLTLFAFWHMPEALGQIMQLPVPGILVALTMFLTSVVVTTPIAWLMYKYVERPGVALGRSLAAVQFKEWLPLRPAPADLASPHA
jgi:peptidoglycan/LPS O-acetylase OafA/YrhL